jgi:hypothetical protein
MQTDDIVENKTVKAHMQPVNVNSAVMAPKKET